MSSHRASGGDALARISPIEGRAPVGDRPYRRPASTARIDAGSREHGSRHAARRSATDDKLAAAVIEILREIGPHGVSVEAVAARSGVAKTTIYRRYADSDALLLGVLEQVSPTTLSSDAVPSRADLTERLRQRQEVFEERLGYAAIGRLLSADSEAVAQWRRRFLEPRFGAIAGYFRRGVAAGVLRPGVDYELIAEMVFGGMIVCDALHGDVPDDWADNVVDTLWPLIAARVEEAG